MDKYLSRSVANMANMARSDECIISGKSDDIGTGTAARGRNSEEVLTVSASLANATLGEKLYSWLAAIFPCLLWLRTYSVQVYLKADLIAGFTVGTMIIPQSMSYARLAGLPPIYGLYSGFVPVLVYAIVGSSRQLAIGPVALVSLLVANALVPIVELEKIRTGAGDDLYIQLAILLALMVGVIQFIMGTTRLGWLIRFISHSVISGFTSGSAVIIGLSQAKHFLGYDVTQSSEFIPLMRSIIQGLDKFKWQPFVMGFLVLALLLPMKHLGKSDKRFRHFRAAGPVTGVVLSTLFIKVFRPESISVAGSIPQGFPPVSLHFELDYVKQLLPTAFLIAGVGILESVGIAKSLATKNGYEIDSNRELVGLGLANIVGSIFSAYPTTGSFSRSAVNNDAGAKTGLAGIVTAVVVGSALLFLTPLFSDIPQCTLGAIVVSAVIGLVDYDEAAFLWRVDKKDFLSWVAAAVITLFCGVEFGVLLAVLLSLVFVIYESANPHVAVLGRLPGTTVYRNVKQYSDVYIYHGIAILRIDAPIYFANISHINEMLSRLEEYSSQNANKGDGGVGNGVVHYVILEMSPVPYVDSTGIHAIKELHRNYKARHIQLAFANPNQKVMASLAKAGLLDLIGRAWFFVSVHEAVQGCNVALGDMRNRIQQNVCVPSDSSSNAEQTQQTQAATSASRFSRFSQGTQKAETVPLLDNV